MKSLDVLLVSARPGRNPHISLACKSAGQSAKRGTLRWLHSWHPDLFLFADRTRCTHLTEGTPRGPGAKFPVAEAREAAQQFKIPDSVKVLLLYGPRVAHAFGVPYKCFELNIYRGVPTYCLPYPTGYFWWSRAGNREVLRKMLESIGRMT